ncbi:aminotransferase class I/II-fold pyridoxal phosphate-dependent enzyme [Dietzia sp.]|uniref:aminotransferase class I/II-fold pyridoxal phosphate-dependent enzyme n=1 Tax=Dietzia sp. TaxID=1871616 RepID=UPI002FD8E894
MEVIAAASRRQGSHGDMLSLSAGQPSTPAPRPVLAAARDMLDREILGYTPTPGIPELRRRVAALHTDRYGYEVDPASVVITTGSSGAFTALFLAAFDPGDVVALARPGYPAYRNALAALGCEVAEFDPADRVRFQPSVADLERLTAETGAPPAGLVIASPANPSGAIIDAGELADIAAWCEAHGTLLVSDEIYHGISFGRRCASAWEFSRNAAVIGSFSKYFSMTGWRIGWMLVPDDLAEAVDTLLGNLNICAPANSQFAALKALGPEAARELDGHVERYAANRDLVLGRLDELRLPLVAEPDGAFYAYVDASAYTSDSLSWCREVLDATGVALTPGVDFDSRDGGSTVRISFAGAGGDIAAALDRLAAHFAR